VKPQPPADPAVRGFLEELAHAVADLVLEAERERREQAAQPAEQSNQREGRAAVP